MRPYGATRAGTQATPLPRSVIFFHTIPYKQNNHLRAILPNDINRLRVIHPNETVGAAPACPPERPHSGVSILEAHALCVGDFNDGCALDGATRAGTQAPPLPRSVIFFHTIPYKQNSVHAQFTPNEINPPTRNPPKRNRRGGACVPARTSAQRRFHTQMNTTSHNRGAEMHRALPPPQL